MLKIIITKKLKINNFLNLKGLKLKLYKNLKKI